MMNFEVSEPILNSPYEQPQYHWVLEPGNEPVKAPGRRKAGYYYRDPNAPIGEDEAESRGQYVELTLVNLVRNRITEWRKGKYPGVTRTTEELLKYWQREGREHRLFYAQIEAAETIIFLNEARSDYLQGIIIPLDEPSEDRKKAGYKAFHRYACKMATGSGKTTVMGMLAAWSILNKVHDRGNSRYSDVVLIVCPNVTIRNRLQELDPSNGEASLYRTRDLVPPHLMPDLSKGKVLIINWHLFEPQTIQHGGVGAKVIRAGVEVTTREKIAIGPKTTTSHGHRYLTQEELNWQVNAGVLKIVEESRDKQGNLKHVYAESTKYVESDNALVNRVIGREVGGKQNILIFNDEAHHAYRIIKPEPEEVEEDIFGEKEEGEEYFKEATVWIDGLDKIHKLRGINFCVDMSATPYFLARVGQETNRTFPWVVSDFGLTDAIESGLVKIPQLAVRDTTGAEIPGYFNIWRWILKKLTPGERGGKKVSPSPDAILKWANHPIAMLGGLWHELKQEWEKNVDEQRPPVFIIVCKNTKIAKVLYEWLANDIPPYGIPPANLPGFRNSDGRINTIRVDTKVVHETDTGEAKSDEMAWMRFTLDTVGKLEWPRDRQGRQIYPENFEELAKKLGRDLHPPGRDIRCIVSVGMLTEGWDCSTVTHIIGLRPFMSQLLCEQVVGRGLRRPNYAVGPDGKLSEEVAKILGVPFEIIPFKENKGVTRVAVKRWHVCPVVGKERYEIRFPRVMGYRQAIRNRITVDWSAIAPVRLDPFSIPPEVEMKAAIPSNTGRPSLYGPGKLEDVTLNPFRKDRRFQELVFDLAGHITKGYVSQPGCDVPVHVLFPQVARIVSRYLTEKVRPVKPAEIIDIFLAPYYGWVLELLGQAIKPDDRLGETPELPLYETSRGPGSTSDVDFWTSKEVREAVRCHLNYVVMDTAKWEQSAAYIIDTHSAVEAFVKNAGLGFSIPYYYNGEHHEYIPDFIIRLKGDTERYLILETKGFDERAEVKTQAAHRWCSAVNAEGSFGSWSFVMVRKLEEARGAIDGVDKELE